MRLGLVIKGGIGLLEVPRWSPDYNLC